MVRQVSLPVSTCLTAGSCYIMFSIGRAEVRRALFSSIDAEILALDASADGGAPMADGLRNIMAEKDNTPFVLTVDSDGLYSTITKLHESNE